MGSKFFGGSESIDVLTRGQKQLLNKGTGILEEQFGQAGPVYEGQISPDANYNQLLAFGGAPSMLSQTGDTNPAVQSMLQGQSAYGPIDQEQYFQQAIYDPARQAYEDEKRVMESMYGDTWGQTGGYQDIMQKGAARFGTDIGAQHGQFMLDQQNIANQQRAMGVEGSFGQQSNLADTYQNLLGIGGEQRSIEGQGLEEEFNRWNAGQDYNNPWLGFLGPLVGTQAYAVGQNPGQAAGLAAGMSAGPL